MASFFLAKPVCMCYNITLYYKSGSDCLKLKALRAAFPHTIPILTGFLFLGMTYGVFMRVSGFNFIYSGLISLTVFAGSMQFVAVNLLLGAFDPLQALVMTLMINGRHLFYGISLLEKYRGLGFKKIYMIFGLCDESFSVNCSAEAPEGVDPGWFMFFVTLLNQMYWVAGTVLGGIFGAFIPFSTEGLDFVMTAMFAVIFLEQLLKERDHVPSFIGVGVSVLALALFGADGFIIPALCAVVVLLTLYRGRYEKGGEEK